MCSKAGQFWSPTPAGRRWSPACARASGGGSGDAHHLINETGEDVVYLEMGDRRPGDGAVYPDDDLVAQAVAGGWRYTHKDGTPY